MQARGRREGGVKRCKARGGATPACGERIEWPKAPAALPASRGPGLPGECMEWLPGERIECPQAPAALPASKGARRPAGEPSRPAAQPVSWGARRTHC